MRDGAADPAEVFRRESSRAVAALIRATGEWDLAEDAVQEAFVVALERWPVDGVPQNPGAWITTAARRKLLDRIRREAGRGGKEALAVAASRLVMAEPSEGAATDDELRLFFSCCHPSLPRESQVALTLRALGGLTTAEIARAFLVPEDVVRQRITRAKRKIRDAVIPFAVPRDDMFAARLDAVASVLYLVFNEGYAARAGAELVRVELADEAVRLARLLADRLPHPECEALLALLLLQHARRAARVNDEGELVTLGHQDRGRWNQGEISEALALLERGREPRGAYRIQAEIAAEHARATDAAATDWCRISALYDELVALQPTPVVRLNRAVAVAEALGPEAGLQAVVAANAGAALDRYHLFHAVKGDLLGRAGQTAEAAESYARALALATNDVERRHLARRLQMLAGTTTR